MIMNNNKNNNNDNNDENNNYKDNDNETNTILIMITIIIMTTTIMSVEEGCIQVYFFSLAENLSIPNVTPLIFFRNEEDWNATSIVCAE